jgi:hypothetical protein
LLIFEELNLPMKNMKITRPSICPCYTWAYFRAGPEKSPTQKMPAQARPGPTVGPEISAQA